MQTIDERIRQHAFALWEAAGCPENRAEEFWLRAREVELGLSQPSGPGAEPGPDGPASLSPNLGDFA